VELLQPVAGRAAEYPPCSCCSPRATCSRRTIPPPSPIPRIISLSSLRNRKPWGYSPCCISTAARTTRHLNYAAKTLRRDPEQLEAALAYSRLALGRLDYGRQLQACSPCSSAIPSGAAWSALAQVEFLRSNIPGAEAALAEALRYMRITSEPGTCWPGARSSRVTRRREGEFRQGLRDRPQLR